MEQKIIITALIVIIASFICIGKLFYYIGYIKGFKKCKKIDDDIIKDLSEKYKFVSKTEC